MHRFFISPENIYDGEVRISGSEARHVERVLRLQAGDQITVFDGSGWEYTVLLTGKKGGDLIGEVMARKQVDREAGMELHLVQGIARGERMDLVIQKAAELGVHTIHPLASEYSVVQLQGERAEKKVQRWQQIAREACKQCRRNLVPRVEPIRELTAFLDRMHGEAGIMLYEDEQRMSLRTILTGTDLLERERIYVLVGPEGGFSPREVEMARQAGVTTAGLGKRILRTETAGLVACSILLYEHGELG